MLLVHSRSTERYADDWFYDRKMLVTESPTEETLELEKEDDVIAIGGGSVIDTAKIVSKGPIIAIPTTFSGASRTSHAVFWKNGQKLNLSTQKPITITEPRYLETLPEEVMYYSGADCICHAIESLISKKSNNQSELYASMSLHLIRRHSLIDLLNASLLAGDAIEITGTNMIHALSYALTTIYKTPHAKALAFLLPKLLSLFPVRNISIESRVELSIDVSKVIDEAFIYPKVFECKDPITKEVLMEVLK